MSENVVQFKGREGAEKAASDILESAKAQNATVTHIDSNLDLEKNLPEVKEGEEVVTELEPEELEMLRETIVLAGRIKHDKGLYESQVESNLKKLLERPEMISAYLINKAVYDDVERAVVIRLSKNKNLMGLLKKTMFWRIQERIDLFDFGLSIRKGFKVVKTDPVRIKDTEDAAEMLKKMQFLEELKNSNHPMARQLADFLKDQ